MVCTGEYGGYEEGSEMLFRKARLQLELMNTFMNLIDQKMPSYEVRLNELFDSMDKVSANKCATDELIAEIESLSEQECSHNAEVLERYNQVKQNPVLCGIVFPHNNLTISKIYAFVVWAIINKPPAKNCIVAIDSYFTKAHMRSFTNAVSSWHKS